MWSFWGLSRFASYVISSMLFFWMPVLLSVALLLPIFISASSSPQLSLIKHTKRLRLSNKKLGLASTRTSVVQMAMDALLCSRCWASLTSHDRKTSSLSHTQKSPQTQPRVFDRVSALEVVENETMYFCTSYYSGLNIVKNRTSSTRSISLAWTKSPNS